ncbi:hypothetical protein EV643_115213 [Kribbella sp. VKM Ac-2527]|uniref:Uncharacterized protein n=1 Tax=Kribbella caucasensis TaxID=2512215 RepID=A0A4V3C9B5_9ACTN|nr:hypothetical protein [Kribbella sp. VKM Ac-2527]TDO44711.1 hypothetical protein EV643_115213 [Kribbella sp. VKM Ac-2527]
MADERSQLERWVSFAAGIVAPITVVSTLLFYFGYVSARAQYEYFGIDVDTIGLSTQDYVMRSPQPLLVPLLVLTLLAVAGLLLHNAIQHTTTTVRRAGLIAVALLILGIIALLAYPLLGDLPYYALVVPLAIGLAAATLGYLAYLGAKLRDARPPALLIVLLGIVTTTCAFWATATTAQYSGRGLAKSDAADLDQFPTVILDTKEKLQLRSPGLEETTLRPGTGQTFNYRYRGLHLLVVGQDRLFLVPHTWTPSNTTLVLPLDNSIRVQFQFQNDPP